jgi:hypothetical protein
MSGSNIGGKFSELMSDLFDETLRLIRLEVELVQTEISMKISRLVKHALALAVGGILIALSLATLIGCAVVALSELVSPWLAFLIVGLIICIAGLALIAYGHKGISLQSITPEVAIGDFKKTVRWLKGDSQ